MVQVGITFAACKLSMSRALVAWFAMLMWLRFALTLVPFKQCVPSLACNPLARPSLGTPLPLYAAPHVYYCSLAMRKRKF